MTNMQSKIQEIVKAANLELVAQKLFDIIGGDVADFADAIALARCEELGVEDPTSHDAGKIYKSAEHMLTAAVLRHLKNIHDNSL